MLSLPYDLTLYLDSDARIVYSLDSLFELGRYCDVAAAMATVRHPPGWSEIVYSRLFLNSFGSFIHTSLESATSNDLPVA